MQFLGDRFYFLLFYFPNSKKQDNQSSETSAFDTYYKKQRDNANSYHWHGKVAIINIQFGKISSFKYFCQNIKSTAWPTGYL